METLYNGFTLQLCAGSFPLSTDSMVLAHFANCKPNAKILDLGAGCGTLGLMLCAKNDTCQVTGVEIDPNAHRQALCNAQTNGVSHRLTSICSDISSGLIIHNRQHSQNIALAPQHRVVITKRRARRLGAGCQSVLLDAPVVDILALLTRNDE